MQNVWHWIRKRWQAEPWLFVSVLTIAGLLLIFGSIADEVMEGSTSAFDRYVILAFRSAGNSSDPIGPPWVQEMARDITALGSVAVLAIILFAVVGYLFLSQKRTAAWLVLAAVVGGEAMNSLLKHGFARTRPDFVTASVRIFTASFPSGHAAMSAITYLTLAALLARTTPSRRLRLYFVTIGIVLTLFVGVSRVYLGVHYPTDVLAGWCVGAAWALGCWAIMTPLQRAGEIGPSERP